LGAAVCAVFLALSHPVAARGQGAAETLEARIAESRTYGEATLAALGEADRTKIAAGRPVALLEDIPESPVKIGKGIGVIPYPPEVVWQVLNDYSNYKEFMPFTKESTVDLVRSGGDTVYFSSELSVPLLNDRYYSLKITSEENVEGQRRTYFISWTLDPERSSNLYLNSGSWKLVPYGPEGNRTLAFYTVITDPGGNIPISSRTNPPLLQSRRYSRPSPTARGTGWRHDSTPRPCPRMPSRRCSRERSRPHDPLTFPPWRPSRPKSGRPSRRET